jgi:hypothetical protein
VNGNQARVEKTLDLVRAVKVPAGKSKVEMIYRPWGFRLGLWATLVSALLWLAAAGMGSQRVGAVREPPLPTADNLGPSNNMQHHL